MTVSLPIRAQWEKERDESQQTLCEKKKYSSHLFFPEKPEKDLISFLVSSGVGFSLFNSNYSPINPTLSTTQRKKKKEKQATFFNIAMSYLIWQREFPPLFFALFLFEVNWEIDCRRFLFRQLLVVDSWFGWIDVLAKS